eukprot:6021999-Karenia_brevis.AAC.1
MPEGVTYKVPWNIILGYELEIRREACKKVLEDNLTFAVAIENACRDTYLRDVHLVAPTTLASSTSSPGGSKRAYSPDNDKGKGRGGKSKSQKKGAKTGGSKSGKLAEFEGNPQKLKNRFNK